MKKTDKISDMRGKVTEYRKISGMKKNTPVPDQARGSNRPQGERYTPPEPRFTTSPSILR